MKAKLQHLIKSEGLTASRFAEMLEIQPAGVSHILAGRNKPSFDLLQKILRRFPKINPDWLLLDSEKMYRDEWMNAGDELGSSATSGEGGASQNSGMGIGSLFGSVGGDGLNFAGGSNFSGGGAAGSGGQGKVRGQGNFGGPDSNTRPEMQNLSHGETDIYGRGVGSAVLTHSHTGLPVTKIVIFYADGTFEAYSPSK